MNSDASTEELATVRDLRAAWGTTWYAITFQLGHTTPEVGVALRFALAGSVILAICVYHAERHIVSGLVAVGYSACASRDAS